jgi:hypothetical protein
MLGDRQTVNSSTALTFGLVTGVLMACSHEGPSPEAAAIGLRLAEALAHHKVSEAYAMTSPQYQESTPMAAFEERARWLIPPDFGTISEVVVVDSNNMHGWRSRENSDIGWAYVSIQGEFGQAVTVIVSNVNGKALVRDIEWGKP